MSQVHARFFIQTVTRHASVPDGVQVVLVASGRGAENKDWAKWTPMGKIEMQVNDPGGAQWFLDRLGKDVALTFTERPMVCPTCKIEVAMAGEHAEQVRCPQCEQVVTPA